MIGKITSAPKVNLIARVLRPLRAPVSIALATLALNACKPELPQRVSDEASCPPVTTCPEPVVCPDAAPPVCPEVVPPTVSLIEGERGLVALANGRDAVVTKARSGETALDLRVNIDATSFGQDAGALPAGLTAELQTAEGTAIVSGLAVQTESVNSRNILKVTGNLPESAAAGTAVLVIKDAQGRELYRIVDALRVTEPASGRSGPRGGQQGDDFCRLNPGACL